MKILNRADFLKIPAGTIYAKGKPWYFGGLTVKHETTTMGDWWSLDPCWIESHDLTEAVDRLEAMRDQGASYPMQDAIGRDGLDEADALFLVFEMDDLVKLRKCIDRAMVNEAAMRKVR